MTKKEFIKILKDALIDFYVEKGVIVVSNTNKWLTFHLYTELPEGVRFENTEFVWLNSKATRFNPVFRNKGDIVIVSYDKKSKSSLPTQHGVHLIINSDGRF